MLLGTSWGTHRELWKQIGNTQKTLGRIWEHNENPMGMSWEADVNRVTNLMGGA